MAPNRFCLLPLELFPHFWTFVRLRPTQPSSRLLSIPLGDISASSASSWCSRRLPRISRQRRIQREATFYFVSSWIWHAIAPGMARLCETLASGLLDVWIHPDSPAHVSAPLHLHTLSCRSIRPLASIRIQVQRISCSHHCRRAGMSASSPCTLQSHILPPYTSRCYLWEVGHGQIAEAEGSFEIEDIDAKLSTVERETAIDMIISAPLISTPVKRVLFCLDGEALSFMDHLCYRPASQANASTLRCILAILRDNDTMRYPSFTIPTI